MGLLIKNKNIKIITTLCLIISIIFPLEIMGFAAATSIKTSVSQVTIQPNGTYQLSVILTPNSSSGVKWSSSNTAVATVNSKGLIKGINSGTAVITCTTTDGSNLSASCTVTVSQLISSLSLNASSIELYTGNEKQITVNINPSNATNKTLKWSSNNNSIATVNGNGIVKGVAPGTVTITCNTTDGSKKSASCTVIVKQGVTSISLNKNSATLGVGNSTQLTATVQPSNATNKSVNWSSGNGNVASVDSNGKVTAKGEGTATITCISTDGTNKKATCVVSVKHIASNPAPTAPATQKNSQSTSQKQTTTQKNATTQKQVTESITQKETVSVIETLPTEEVTGGESVTLPQEEFEDIIDDVFDKEDDKKEDEKEYSIDMLLNVQCSQSKKTKNLLIYWTSIVGLKDYEIYFASSKDKKHIFTDDEYIFVGTTTGNFYEIINYPHGNVVSIKIRAVYETEDGIETTSDFSTAINAKTKKISIFNRIKEWFDIRY